MNTTSFNCVRVSLSALRHNYGVLQKFAGAAVPLMAMVKADGYGHGMVHSAKAFAESGCTCFGVAELGEGISLRKAGVEGDIYITLGFLKEDPDLFFHYRLTPVIYNLEQARLLAAAAKARKQTIGLHIKVDTGMTRLGIFPEELTAFLGDIEKLSGLRVEGIMSHFPESDNPQSQSTEIGLRHFQTACRSIKEMGGTICHIANSGAVLNFPDSHCDMVRAGIALYGYDPAGKERFDNSAPGWLLPAMSFSTSILQVKTIREGTGVSYGHTFKASTETKIAVLPVGYEDGFGRVLSNRGEVLIHGHRVPVRGRVCMNMSMVDVTGIDGVEAGDEAVILGCQGEQAITADDVAAKMNTISYEVLCLLGNSNLREYIE